MILALLLGAAAIDRTPAAARAVVVRYYHAIEQRRFRDAYRCWSGGGQASGKTLTAFTRGFAHTAHARVVAGAPVDGDAGAGSLFVQVPVTVIATLHDGTRQRFVGRYTLRRVNDVYGATPEQLRWHLMTASLKPV